MFVLAHIGITVGVVYLAYHLMDREKLVTMDLRWLVLGAMLPDIIDKTLGMVILPEVFGHGRLYFHSITVVAIASMIAMIVKRESVYFLSIGMWCHLLLDSMWWEPKTFLWPFLGLKLPAGDFEVSMWIDTLLHNPYVQATEVFGAAIIIGVGYRHGMLRWEGIKGFFMEGRLKRWEE